jgi:alanine dehydrogenase
VHAVRLKSDILTWPRHADGSRTREKHSMQPGVFCGLVLLFSTANGEPLAILNDGYLQHLRVGAAAGIGARLLARADAQSVGLIGTGGMARTVLEAMRTVRNIDTVRVYSRSADHRVRFAQQMSAQLDIAVTPVSSAREAVRRADILVAATDSLLPVVEAAWLEPGMHIVAIGPQDLAAECEARLDVVVRQGEESLDLPEDEHFRRNPGYARNAFISGNAVQRARLPSVARPSKPARVWPLYVDVLAGRASGRTRDAQITQYRPVGNWGLQFAACGAAVYRAAKARGLGRELPTGWFMQNIRN